MRDVSINVDLIVDVSRSMNVVGPKVMGFRIRSSCWLTIMIMLMMRTERLWWWWW